MTVRRLPSPAEPLGLLLALFGLATLIDPPIFCPAGPREYRERFDEAICFDTSSRSISTVVYPKVCPSQLAEFMAVSWLPEGVMKRADCCSERRHKNSMSVGHQ
jgi:hypothetical protein